MPKIKLSESEATVMEALWEHGSQTASEVARTLRPAMHWAENTVRTLLARLLAKGALKTEENPSGTRVFSPALKREAYVKYESASFIQRVFRGASQPLLVHFARNAQLSPKEVEELKALLDQSLKKQP
jgi:BlaI family penicillinase repressor